MHIEDLEWVDGEARQHLCLVDFGATVISSGTLALKAAEVTEFGRAADLTTILQIVSGTIQFQSDECEQICQEGQMVVLRPNEVSQIRAINDTRAFFTHFGKRSLDN